MWVPIDQEPKVSGWLRQQRWRRPEESGGILIFKLVESSANVLFTQVPQPIALQKAPVGAVAPSWNKKFALAGTGDFLSFNLPNPFSIYSCRAGDIAQTLYTRPLNTNDYTEIPNLYRLPCASTTGPREISFYSMGDNYNQTIYWGSAPVDSPALLAIEEQDKKIVNSRFSLAGGSRVYELEIDVNKLRTKVLGQGLGRYVGVIFSGSAEAAGYACEYFQLVINGLVVNYRARDLYQGKVLKKFPFTISAQLASPNKPMSAQKYVSSVKKRLGGCEQMPTLFKYYQSGFLPSYECESSAVFQIDTLVPSLSRWISPNATRPDGQFPPTYAREVSEVEISTFGVAISVPDGNTTTDIATFGVVASKPWQGYQI